MDLRDELGRLLQAEFPGSSYILGGTLRLCTGSTIFLCDTNVVFFSERLAPRNPCRYFDYSDPELLLRLRELVETIPGG